METKCFEVRDKMTFCPVICIRPLPDNEEQRWLLRRDGYSCDPTDDIIIYISNQCGSVQYDPYKWREGERTHRVAHAYICEAWNGLVDGDVIDVEYILGETKEPKKSERDSGL